jgi:glyoxylase-like metal-dependent hydrolase (beta-lactamase superfamily II)
LKLYFNYCSYGFSNCYILGTDDASESSPREAIIIDPGSMGVSILRILETNEYTLKAVLITHDHLTHVRGLKTLIKIYNADIYAINPVIRDIRTTLVRDGDTINIGSFKTEVISVPGHSADCAVYKIGSLLFTGDVLSAGMVGSTDNAYASANQMTALRNNILSLPVDCTVLPGHGPPSSLEAERRFNAGIISFKDPRTRRQTFKIES